MLPLEFFRATTNIIFKIYKCKDSERSIWLNNYNSVLNT